MNFDQQLAELLASLGGAAVRNTASAISSRVQIAKAKKEAKETIHELEEIIDDLLSDKAELLRIGRAYEQEFIAQQISAENIEYITTRFIPVLKDVLKQMSGDESGDSATNAEKFIDTLTPLLSTEMLTVLQLVGFNFKKAIGEPLTELLRSAIASKAAIQPLVNAEYNILQTKLSIEVLKVAQDEDATERLERLKSGIL
jgi:hypothetical protein